MSMWSFQLHLKVSVCSAFRDAKIAFRWCSNFQNHVMFQSKTTSLHLSFFVKKKKTKKNSEMIELLLQDTYNLCLHLTVF